MTTVKKTIFWAKYRLYDKQALDYYASLIENQQLSSKQLGAINWTKRKAIVAHAYESIPFYRTWFEQHNFHPQNLNSIGDWDRVPILTKSVLRDHFVDLMWPECKPTDRKLSTTGGSTGIPMKVYHDKGHPMAALGWRMLGWWGVSPEVDAAFVYRLTRQSSKSRLLNTVLWWPTRRIWLDASHMTHESIEAFIKQYNKLSPGILQGYAGAIVHLARHLQATGLRCHRPHAVWVTASPINAPDRKLVESTFSAPVFDQYGCGEVFWIAAQCERRQGLHVFSDSRHVEIVDENGWQCPPNIEGQLVVTDLDNRVFPIIRYQNDDRAALWDKVCECGRCLPLMSPIAGRVTDLVALPDGSIISGEYLTTIFDTSPDLVQSFQVVQHTDMSLTLRVVPQNYILGNDTRLAHVLDSLSRKTGGQVPVRLELVDSITHNRGKLQYVISEVKSTDHGQLAGG